MLNNSVATIFNVQWLHNSWGSLIFGLVLACLGYWTLFSELIQTRPYMEIYRHVFLHGLLFAGLFFKFGLGW